MQRLIRLIIIISSFAATQATECAGRTYFVSEGREIRLFNEKNNFEQARASCKVWGQMWHSGDSGKLVSIASEEEQQCIEDMIRQPRNYDASQWGRSNPVEPGYYVGATDVDIEGSWVWPNGRAVGWSSDMGLHDGAFYIGFVFLGNAWEYPFNVQGYSNWARDEPNNQGRFGEDCLVLLMVDTMYPEFTAGKWLDIPCNSQRFYICEREISPSLNWGYENNPHALAPNSWPQLQPTCGGSRQSPINIHPYVSQTCPTTDRLIKGWRQLPDSEWKVINTGRFIKIEPSPRRSMWTMFRRNFERYYISHMILKWGDDDSVGSDHAIGGVHTAGELQVYHELDSSDEVHALSFFLEPRSTQQNTNWAELIRYIGYVQEAGQEVTMPSPYRVVRQLLGDSSPIGAADHQILSTSVRYRGSLPYPPCTENVVWTVFPEPIHLSYSQFSTLRQTRMEGGEMSLTNNFRPLQAPRNGDICHIQRF